MFYVDSQYIMSIRVNSVCSVLIALLTTTTSKSLLTTRTSHRKTNVTAEKKTNAHWRANALSPG